MEKEDTLAITEAVTPEESFQVFQVFEVAENRRAKPGNKDPAWNEPIKKELETLKKHGVFEVVRDPGKRANKAPMMMMMMVQSPFPTSLRPRSRAASPIARAEKESERPVGFAPLFDVARNGSLLVLRRRKAKGLSR